MKTPIFLVLLFLFVIPCGFISHGQNPGEVISYKQLSNILGSFYYELDYQDYLGQTAEVIGDLDKDGNPEIAISAFRDDDGGNDKGAFYILFLDSNRDIKKYQKISSTSGNFTGILENEDYFGGGIASLGDFDKDGTPDVVVAANGDDDGGSDVGCLYILFLKSDGTVKSHIKISKLTDPGLSLPLTDLSRMGYDIDTIGDLNKDGVIDLIVPIPTYTPGAVAKAGGVLILFLKSTGYVKSYSLITNNSGGLGNVLKASDYFGFSVSCMNDYDHDGFVEIAVGSPLDDSYKQDAGAIYIFKLKSSGYIQSYQKITTSIGGFSEVLNIQEMFGASMCTISDINCDGYNELVVGAPSNDNSGYYGRVFVLNMSNSMKVGDYTIIGNNIGNFKDTLKVGGQFGYGLANAGDLNGDGIPDLLICARSADFLGNPVTGDMWMVNIEGIIALNPLNITIEKQDISCYGFNDGKINAQISGGMKPYSIKWSSGDTGLYIENLKKNEYIITITDKKGCKASNSSNINEPSKLKISFFNKKDVLCFGGNDGAVTASVSGGIPPYVFNWSVGNHSSQLSNVKAGNHKLVITDSNNCEITDSVVIKDGFKVIAENIIGPEMVIPQQQAMYVVNNNPDYDYFWTLTGGAVLSGQGTNSVNIYWGNKGDGDISLIASHDGNCFDTSSMHVRIWPLNINNKNFQEVALFPDPAKDFINLKIPKVNSNCIEISVFSLQGNIVQFEEYNSTDSGNKISININHLKSGVYFLMINDSKSIYKGKFIKQ